MKKFLSFTLALFLTGFVFAQIQSNTGSGNPFKNLGQEEKDSRLYEIVTKICSSEKEDTKRNETIFNLLLDSGANPNYIPEDEEYSMLHSIIWEKKAEYVKKLVKAGADVNRVTNAKNSLFTAVYRNCGLDVIQTLVEAGADLKWQNKEGQSIIYYAIREDSSLDVIRYLLESGASATVEKDSYYNPVVIALRNGNLELLDLLEKYGGTLKTVSGKNDMPPIIMAVDTCELDVVKYVFDHGYKITDIPNNEVPPVLTALSDSKFDIADYLIEKGDNINRIFKGSNNENYSGLQWLVSRSKYYRNRITPEIFQKALELKADPYLKPDKKNDTFDYCVKKIRYKDTDKDVYRTAATFLYYADLEGINTKHKLTLEEAILLGKTDAIPELLAKYKKEAGTKNLYEYLLCFNETAQKHKEIIDILWNAGYRPDYSVVWKCFKENRGEVAEYFVEKGMSLTEGDGTFKGNILSYLAKDTIIDYNEKDFPFFQFLFKNGFTVDQKIFSKEHPDGIPLLHFFVHHDCTTDDQLFVSELLNNGADINEIWKGNAPIHEASKNYYSFACLLNHGADPYLKNDSGKTAVYYIENISNLYMLRRILFPSTMYMKESREIYDYEDEETVEGQINRGQQIQVLEVGSYANKLGTESFMVRICGKNSKGGEITGWVFGGALSKDPL